MADRWKVIKGLEICSEHGSWHGLDCELNEEYKDCPYRGCETGCIVTIAKDAIALLRDQEPVKPSKTLDGNGNLWRDCGECGGVLPKHAQYCPTCGRKVMWDG